MRFQTKTGAVTGLKSDCVIAPVYTEDTQPPTTRSVDKAASGGPSGVRWPV